WNSLFPHDLAAPQVLPGHLDLQIDLQFAGVAVARLPQSTLAEIDDSAGEARFGFRFLHQPKMGSLLNLLLDRLGQLVFEEAAVARGFEDRHMHRSYFRIERRPDV